MPIKMLACPDPTDATIPDATAWLAWDADNDSLSISPAAKELLWLDEAKLPTTQLALTQLFEKQSRNKLAITLEGLCCGVQRTGVRRIGDLLYAYNDVHAQQFAAGYLLVTNR